MSKSFQSAERAAKLSWVLPLAGLAFSVMTNQATKQFEDSRTIAIVNAAVLLLLLLSGLICAIYAFCGIPRQGRRGILVPAVIGSVLSGLFLGLFALGFIFAMGYTQPKAKWQDVVSAQGTYQVSIMGNVTRKKSSSGSGQSMITVNTIEGKAYNDRVLMSAEQIDYTPIHGIVPTSELVDPLISETLQHYRGRETNREVIEGDDPRILVWATIANPPGEMRLVVRRSEEVVIFLCYASNDHLVDQAEADRFFDSFQRLDPHEAD